MLAAVRDMKRVAWTQLVDTQVVSLEGRVLTLSFAHAGTMRAFQKGSSGDYLKDALRQALGLDVDIACAFGGAAHEPQTSSAAPGRPVPNEPPAPSPYDGFAPGDEAVPDDPDAPPPPPSYARGEDAALDLVRSELGGKVVDTIGDD